MMKKIENIIDPERPIPLYYQLRELIKEKILNGEWTDGTEIPSENKFRELYNLSRATVKQALDGLVFEGIIIRKQGTGTFVNYQRHSQDLFHELSFKADSERKGLHPTAKLLEAGYSSGHNFVAGLFHLPPETELCRIKRIRGINDTPMIIETNFIAPSFEQDILKEDLTSLAVYKYLEEKNGMKLDSYKVNIRALLLDEFEQEALQVGKNNCGILLGTLSMAGSQPVMYNKRLYRGDKCDLSFEYGTGPTKTKPPRMNWEKEGGPAQ